MFALLALLTGCSIPETSFEGSVAGHSLGVIETAYFGGPFLIFSDTVLECMEVAWVTRYYDDENPPETQDQVSLQVTFFEDDIFVGRFDLGGEAPVGAQVLVIEGDSFSAYKARTGTLVVDELNEETSASGTIELDFGEDGTLKADWATEWCVNVSD